MTATTSALNDDGPLRVVLADDSGIFREGLRLLLESAGVMVLDDVDNVPRLMSCVARHRPDVAIVDVRMPPSHTDEGVQAALALHRDAPETGVLLLSTYVETSWVSRLLEECPGRFGYLLKDRVDDIQALLDALGRVAAGGLAVDPEVVQLLLTAHRTPDPLSRLTDRERDVLALVAQGRSNTGIASHLHVSPKTVETYVAGAFRALDLHIDQDDNRRVRATLAFLNAGNSPAHRRASKTQG
ncbi:MAG: response regulator transcription factor [Humibacillus sp.]|nr:response regulator transcription factor [Humibacillus sp.]MDN5778561.1 response regulator transcription factor [Humibacillus sp.]